MTPLGRNMQLHECFTNLFLMIIIYSLFYRNHTVFFCDQELNLIQSISGGNVNILGGHIIGHSKQKSVYVYEQASYSKRFLI